MDISTVGSAVLVGSVVIVGVTGANVRVAVGDGNIVGACGTSSTWVGCVCTGCTPHAPRAMTNKQTRKKGGILFYSNLSKSILGSLTACITGGWGKQARKRKTTKAQKHLKKRARKAPSRPVHAVLGALMLAYV